MNHHGAFSISPVHWREAELQSLHSKYTPTLVVDLRGCLDYEKQGITDSAITKLGKCAIQQSSDLFLL